MRLPYLNRARLAYSTRHFLSSGIMPGIGEANTNEPLLPWGSYNQVCCHGVWHVCFPLFVWHTSLTTSQGANKDGPGC